jgi:hypothetical protein
MQRSVTTIIAALLVASSAEARSNGIVGYSGQDGLTCDTCHAGGVVPDVRFEGPTTVAAGRTALFRFTVRSHGSEQILAGFNVSATAGTLSAVPEDRGVRASTFAGAVEVTHTQPRDNDDNDEATWLFAWRAPDALGDDVLFGAGNSVDGFEDQSGDESATATVDIRVRCAGDCSDDEAVTVDEVVHGIDIALGGQPLEDCPLADGDGDGSVSISDLVAAVDSAMNGCP